MHGKHISKQIYGNMEKGRNTKQKKRYNHTHKHEKTPLQKENKTFFKRVYICVLNESKDTLRRLSELKTIIQNFLNHSGDMSLVVMLGETTAAQTTYVRKRWLSPENGDETGANSFS